eukprot:UN12526
MVSISYLTNLNTEIAQLEYIFVFHVRLFIFDFVSLRQRVLARHQIFCLDDGKHTDHEER